MYKNCIKITLLFLFCDVSILLAQKVDHKTIDTTKLICVTKINPNYNFGKWPYFLINNILIKDTILIEKFYNRFCRDKKYLKKPSYYNYTKAKKKLGIESKNGIIKMKFRRKYKTTDLSNFVTR
jgi:hypothetical protein